MTVNGREGVEGEGSVGGRARGNEGSDEGINLVEVEGRGESDGEAITGVGGRVEPRLVGLLNNKDFCGGQ